MHQSNGPIFIDLIGLAIHSEERELLQHPLVGGVVLFTRNYQSIEQITELCHSIRSTRTSPILIAVDQEGGRVQRFKEGFTRLPSLGSIGEIYHHSNSKGLEYAYWSGWLMASELLAVGVDISFAPVLDIDKKINNVIGDRSFGNNSNIVIKLSEAMIRGMHDAGMATTGKHFPGHGQVEVDSHVALPVDKRSLPEIYKEDMQPFVAMMASGLDAVMPAHILFPEVDAFPVGFSKYWLQNILRNQLKFSGLIFSDDLNMAAASFAGDYTMRAKSALNAGCDMVLICNNRTAVIKILDQLPPHYDVANEKFNRLKGKFTYNFETLCSSKIFQQSLKIFDQLQETL